jgi:predicted house-cleaning noncanonical NTP pyrophosphatase (MazG superfamily)
VHICIAKYKDANIDEECLEELVDILELAYVLGKMHGASFEELEVIRRNKRELKGGFDKKCLFLVEDVS